MNFFQPKITIYITNYNYQDYITQSIESVLNQTFQDFELLIIDDGSTDESKTIIEAYRNYPKIQIIYQKNKGLNITNNIAMRLARGKYIMRLDADDYLEENALELMYKQLENDEQLGLVFPNYFYVDKEGNKIGEEIRHDFSKEVSLLDLPAHGACTMIRLQFLKDIGGYNEDFSCQDGYDLWIKFITHYKISNLPESLFSYRRHGENLTTNEEKILETRKRIKNTFIESFRLDTPKTVAILPIRNMFYGKENLPFYKVDGETFLSLKIKELLKSEKIGWIVVTTSENEIIELLQDIDFKDNRLIVIKRPEELSRQNVSLNQTYKHVLGKLAEINIYPEAIMSVALEFPFIKSDVFDDAINTLSIFKSDSLITLRPENRMFYQHKGEGMIPILDQDKFTKLEREALYRGAGGISLSLTESFINCDKITGGKVSHIVLDEKSAFGILSPYDFEIFKKIR